MVIESTNQYREEQDIILEFHNDTFNPEPSKNGYGIKHRDLMTKFKEWYSKMGQGGSMNVREAYNYFEKRYGKYNQKTGWLNFSYKSEYENVDGFNE